MKKSAILFATTAIAVTAPAQAREGEVYIGIDAGLSVGDQVDVDIADTDPQQNAAFAETEMGFDVGGVIGYDFGPFRLEGEIAYKDASFDEITALDAAGDALGLTASSVFSPEGGISILSGMINGLFEVGSDDGLQAFAGGGVGIASVDINVAEAGAAQIVDDSSSDFAWQLLGGIRFPVSEKVDVGLKYRYFNVSEFEFDSVSGAPLEADYHSHSVLASLVYNFGGAPDAPPPVVVPAPPPPPTPAPPPPPIVAAPPPPPPCNTGPYIVFFDWDQSDITPEAASTLNSAISAYSNCGTARVMLAGHTDRSGSVSYNMGLAERRNASVREYLSGRGVPDARIAGEAFGESSPRVPTADGIRELQNRRVEVTYGPGSGM
ncbi:MAG: OmpA family protein [Pseudomonadota bacterium]